MIKYLKYFFYIFLSLIIIFIVFNNYNNKKILEKKTDKTKILEKKEKSSESNNMNIVENIEYSSFDKKGNEYLIKAKNGELDHKNLNNIFMKNVYAKITFINLEYIEITSDYANYNKETSETLFYDNVLSSYVDHNIISNELQLLFKDKIAKIRDKVVYTSKNGRLEADIILLNLINKKAKILMNNSEEKIKISYLN